MPTWPAVARVPKSQPGYVLSVLSSEEARPGFGPGTLLGGRYRLEDRIGLGAMGEVWSGVDVRLGRPVAVKLLRTDVGSDEDLPRRFEAEGRAAARLVHPNAVTVFDASEQDGRAFLVMECLPGSTLADQLGRGRLPPEEVRSLALQVLGALGAAHRLGLVHRDVKPANLLLASYGTWKLADFGIARSLTDHGDLTVAGLVYGTPAYLAPERIDGQPATAASDLFSLGVVMYEALAGRQPFQGGTPLAVAAAVRNAPVEPLRALCPGLDPRLEAVVTRALAKDPARRFAAAEEMALALGSPGATTCDPSLSPTAVLGASEVLPTAGTATVHLPARVHGSAPLRWEQTRATTARAALRRHRRAAAAAVAALLVVLALVLGHHPSGPAPTAPALSSSSSSSSSSSGPGGVSPSLSHALGQLQQAVRP